MSTITLDSRRTSSTRALLLWVTVPLVVAMAIAIAGAYRSGFSPDEEITSLVVDRVAREGVPRLPSGVVYLRGVVYSYVSAVAGATLGYDIRSYRLVSVLFTGAFVVAGFLLGKQLDRPELGFVFAAALAVSPLHAAAAAVARFYAPFSAAYLASLYSFARTQQSWRSRHGFLVALAAARLLHEFAASLVLLPLIACVSPSLERTQRRRLLLLAGQSVATVAAIRFLTGGIQRVSLAATFSVVPQRASFEMAPALLWPQSPVISATPSWPLAVIALVFVVTGYALAKRTGRPAFAATVATLTFFFQVGAALAAAAVASIVHPRGTIRYCVITAALVAVSIAMWPLCTAWASGAELNGSFVAGLLSSSLLVPEGGLRQVASVFPLTGLLAGLAVIDTLCRPRSMSPTTRVLYAFAVINVAMFSIVDVDFQGRYAVLASPLVLLLAADAVERAFKSFSNSGRAWRPSPAGATLLAAAVLAGLTVIERLPAPVEVANPLAAYAAATRAVFPTNVAIPASDIRDAVGAGSFVLCNDEAACAYLVGRCDGWFVERPDLFPSAFGEIGGEPRGMYALARVIQSAQLTEEVRRFRTRGPVAVVVLDTAKFGFGRHVPYVLRLAQELSGRVSWLASGVLVVQIPKRDGPVFPEEG